jgi:copper oxidase (laccase) domain-containing protein
VAALHAGWRGLAGGILAEGVRAVREAAGESGPVGAAIGPGIGGCCYEVGPEVHTAFAGYGPGVRQGGRLDLKATARAALAAAGVDTVHDIGLCTRCGDPALFFSHRRDAGVTGRQAGLAWLTPEGDGRWSS